MVDFRQTELNEVDGSRKNPLKIYQEGTTVENEIISSQEQTKPEKKLTDGIKSSRTKNTSCTYNTQM